MEESETISKPPLSVKANGGSSFTGDVLKLASGTTAAQVLTLAASPVLTRLFAPEAFGLLALFTSFMSILGVVVCLRYERAILLPDDNGQAANLLAASLLITTLFTLVTIPIVWFKSEIVLAWLSANELGPYLWLVPPMVFVSGAFLGLNYWNTRTKHFGRLSIARVSSSLASNSAKLGAGIVGYVSGGYLIGATVGGNAIATAVLGGYIWRSDRKLFLSSINWHGMLDGIKRYRKFPLVDIWGAFLNNVSWQIPVFMLAYYFSQTEVGFYSLALRLIYLPMSLIGAALGQVYFQRASEVRKNQTYLSDTTRILFQKLVALCVLPALLLSIIGSDAFSIVFGVEWAEAGTYAQILSIWMFFWFISSPLSGVFTVLERQERLFVVHIAIFGSRVVSLAIGGVLGDVRLALWLFSLSGAVVYGGLVLWNLLLAGVSYMVIVKTLTRYLLYSLPAAAPVFAGKLINLEPLLLIALAVVDLLVYYLVVLRTDLLQLGPARPVLTILKDKLDR